LFNIAKELGMFKLLLRTGLLVVFLLLPLAIFAQDQPWQVIKSTHFNIFYKNAPEDVLNELTQKAEECYDSIGDEFGFNRFDFWTWDKRAKIYLYDSKEEYVKATQSLNWSGGQVIVGMKLIQSYVGALDFMRNVLPHELTHIIFLEMVGFNNPAVPLWLQEGVATYQEKRLDLSRVDLVSKINDGSYLDLKALNNFQLKTADNVKVWMFYVEAYSLVKYLITKFGKDAFVDFCRNLRDNKNLTVALSKTYSFTSLDDFEVSWKQYILK
jgi:hypothetical protein